MKKAELKARLAEAEARAARLARGLHKIEQLKGGGTAEMYHHVVQRILDETLGDMRHANRVLREVYEPAIREQLNSVSASALFPTERRVYPRDWSDR